MRVPSLDALLLAGVGSLTAHELAYLPGSVSGVSHGHLPTMWTIAGAIAIATLGRSIIMSLRTRTETSVHGATLGLTIAGMYTVQESLEFVVAGAPLSELVVQPTLWLGLLLAPIVGFVLAALVRTIIELAVGEPAAPTVVWVSAPTWPTGVDAARSIGVLRHALCRRGPPVVVVA